MRRFPEELCTAGFVELRNGAGRPVGSGVSLFDIDSAGVAGRACTAVGIHINGGRKRSACGALADGVPAEIIGIGGGPLTGGVILYGYPVSGQSREPDAGADVIAKIAQPVHRGYVEDYPHSNTGCCADPSVSYVADM